MGTGEVQMLQANQLHKMMSQMRMGDGQVIEQMIHRR